MAPAISPQQDLGGRDRRGRPDRDRRCLRLAPARLDRLVGPRARHRGRGARTPRRPVRVHVQAQPRAEGHGAHAARPRRPARPRRWAACSCCPPRTTSSSPITWADGGREARTVAPSLSILGATGSVGTQALDVVARHPGAFELDCLSARRNLELLCALAATHRPRTVVVPDAAAAREVEAALPRGTGVLVGDEGLEAAASSADVVLNAVVGFAGVAVTLAALRAGRRLALGEQGVADRRGAPRRRRSRGDRRAPSSCRSTPSTARSTSASRALARARTSLRCAVRRLVLTASGGPFRGRGHDELASVTRRRRARRTRRGRWARRSRSTPRRS